MYVTYFKGDKKHNLKADYTVKSIWKKYFPENKILPFGLKENFWEMGSTGPCGPCTEIHYDLLERKDVSDFVNKDDPFVVEIWNLVFVSFDRKKDHSLTKLPKCHVDTGMGLERLACVLQGKKSNYDTDIFADIFKGICEVTRYSGKYTGAIKTTNSAIFSNKEIKIADSFRIVADHVRAICISIADGAIPDCVGRGYVIRRILRRALRFGKVFFENEPFKPFIYKLVPIVANSFKGFYDNVAEKSEKIAKIILEEEKSFIETLEKGETLLKRIIKKQKLKGSNQIMGQDAFKLYSSFGFPIDLTVLVAKEEGFSVDLLEFEKAQKADKLLSKTSKTSKCNSMTSLTSSELEILKKKINVTDTNYQYKNEIALKSIVQHVIDHNNEDKIVILDKTSFYAEAGGQIYDCGEIVSDKSKMAVKEVKNFAGLVFHYGTVSGNLREGDLVICNVDYNRRKKILSNHTFTHILNHSLRKILGNEIEQKGSKVVPEKFTFDINSNPLTLSNLNEIEISCNQTLNSNLNVYCSVIPLKIAKEIRGVRAVFGELYPDPVRVISIGITFEEIFKNTKNEKLENYSIELCGGTHLNKTKEAKSFCILSESGIGKGIRRLTCVTNKEALNAQKLGFKLISELKKAMNLEIDSLQKFMKEKLSELKIIKKNKKSIPLISSIKIEELKNKLVDKIKTFERKERAKLEKKAILTFDEVYKTIVCLNSEKEKKDFKSMDKIFKTRNRISTNCIVIYCQEILNLKILKKALNTISKKSNYNIMLISPTQTKKGLLKLTMHCCSNDPKFSSSEWMNFTMLNFNGKGSGNKKNATGQSPIIKIDNDWDNLDKLLIKTVSFSE